MIVSVEVDGGCVCGGEEPEIRKKVEVYPLQFVPTPAMAQAPVGWNPTVMPLVRFAATHPITK